MATQESTKTSETTTKKTSEHDILTNLPDDILHHILSFLDTQFAVQTSLLSKRFSHLCLSLPSLNINSNSFRYYSSFFTFVVSLLSLKHTHLHTLNFSVDFSNPIFSSIQLSIDSHDLFQPLVKRVIGYCVNHGVPHLSLHFPRIVDELPHLFNCGSLRKLDLFEVVFMPNVKLDFVALKSLNLVKCSFVLDGEGVLDPFECCFNLEDLVVCDCRVPSRVKVLKISAPKLVDLTISKMEHLRNINGYCKIVVSSTKMRSFKLIESHILDYFIPFIERVEVDIVLDGYLSALRPFVRVEVEVPKVGFRMSVQPCIMYRGGPMTP